MTILKKITFVVLAATILTVAIVLYFHYGTGQKGLYEYVRQADDLIAKGNYDKGLALLKKAYGESSDNKDIKNDLSYAYRSYAFKLAEDKKYASAITIMEQARDVMGRSPDIDGVLSYVYCLKAADEAEKGEMSSAAKSVGEAVDLVVDYKRARMDISNVLFNKAGEAFHRDDRLAFLLFINGSYALWERPEALDFMGEFYYREADPAQAAFYWSKAMEIDPGNGVLKEKLDKAKKEVAVSANMGRIRESGMDIRFFKDYGLDTDALRDVVKKVYDDVGNMLGYYPASDTPFILYSMSDFKGIFNQSEYVRGFYDGSIRIPLPEDIKDGEFITLVAHEYTHAVVSIITDKKCPVWLNEGIACLAQSEYSPFGVSAVKAYLNSGGKLSIKNLDEGFAYFEDPAVMALSYQGAYLAVKFITEKWGMNGLRGLLARIRAGRHYTNAIDEEFYLSMRSFESLLNDYAAEKTGAGASDLS